MEKDRGKGDEGMRPTPGGLQTDNSGNGPYLGLWVTKRTEECMNYLVVILTLSVIQF